MAKTAPRHLPLPASSSAPDQKKSQRANADPTASTAHAAAVRSKVVQALAPAQVDAAALPSDLVELGHVLGAWGVRGAVKLAPYSADAQVLQQAAVWYLLPPATGRRPAGGALRAPLKLAVQQLREQGDGLVASFEGLDDRDVAEALRGAQIAVPRSDFPPLPEGEYYWLDLLGMAVHNREGVLLGTVQDMLSNGPQSVLVVQQQEEAGMTERLIPFVEAYVDGVDPAARLIRVDWQPDY
ncbi:ribosome maturation factor RimM [Corticibacter populi]|uniref:Ribosome maturation factor RimM n=1 Tax=Corticibacter populi TaxID=1550736 RepID=A0A3M6R076_9BURK|nr:ribosome maturation factor RimM [Corticibacter populi]RMX08583.1 ribosome maturation factor RimM [Corticibacter populi]RZS35907.1 16S rRNA processing protein RimM [Corticibacter populi]